GVRGLRRARRWRGPLQLLDDAPLLVDDARGDLGAPDINSDRQAHDPPPRGAHLPPVSLVCPPTPAGPGRTGGRAGPQVPSGGAWTEPSRMPTVLPGRPRPRRHRRRPAARSGP